MVSVTGEHNRFKDTTHTSKCAGSSVSVQQRMCGRTCGGSFSLSRAGTPDVFWAWKGSRPRVNTP